jgi:hypothetical protein
MKCLVLTSIAGPETPVLQKLTEECSRRRWKFILIGDLKISEEFHIEGCEYYSLKMQKKLPFKLARLCPEGSYARKNIGYLRPWLNVRN